MSTTLPWWLLAVHAAYCTLVAAYLVWAGVSLWRIRK